MTKYFSQNHSLFYRSLTFCLLLLGSLNDLQAQCGPQGCVPLYRPSTTNPISSLPSPIVASIRSVVRVRHETVSGTSLGTATLVAKRVSHCYFVTCAHLFDEGRGQTSLIKRNDSISTTMPAEIVAIDQQHDVALLRTRQCDLIPVKTNEVPSSGELVACGFGSTGQMRAIRGLIVGQAIPNGAKMPSLRMRGSVRPGDSGGPVLDALGGLVAIVWGERNGETYAIYGRPLEKILARIPRPLQAIKTQPSPNLSTPCTAPIPDSAWFDRLEERIGSLEANVGESNRKLSELANVPKPVLPTPTAPLRTVPSPILPPIDRPTQKANGNSPRFSKLFMTWKISEFFLGAASVGGPIGVALLFGNLWWQRKKKRRTKELIRTRNQPVAVDSPPPPQRIVPETRYVSYEKDEFARAHQWASEQLARKFPGSVEMLTSLDSLIRQQLAGSRDD